GAQPPRATGEARGAAPAGRYLPGRVRGQEGPAARSAVEHSPATEPRRAPMANPVVHFEILGRDAAKTQQYYRDLFGWEINADNPMQYGVIAPGEGGIGGGVGASPMGQPIVTVYVQAADPQAALDR